MVLLPQTIELLEKEVERMETVKNQVDKWLILVSMSSG